MACGITNPLGCLGSLAAKAAKAAGGSVFTAIADYFGDAAKEATTWLWKTMGEAGAVQIGGPGWTQDLGITVALSLIIGTALFLLQVIVSAVRMDMGGMGRAFRGLLIAFVAGGAAITVTELLLQATDALATGIMVAGTGESTWSGLGQRLVATSAISNIAAPAVLLLIALVVVIASVIVWGALMIRKLLLITSAVFAPVAFAGSLADITAGWVKKWIELTAALIFSKLILVIIFVLGLGVLDNGLGEATVGGGTAGHLAQSTTQLVTGCLILAMAGFAPWLAIKLVHFAGDSFHTIHSHAMAAQGAGQSAVAAPQKLAHRASSFRQSSQPRGSQQQVQTQQSSPQQAQSKPATSEARTSAPGAEATSGGPGGGVAAAGGEGAGGGVGAAGVAAPVGLAVAGAVAAKKAGQAGAGTVSDVADEQPGSSGESSPRTSNGSGPQPSSPPSWRALSHPSSGSSPTGPAPDGE
jgi:type IV secretion system protein TrbL